MLLTLVVVKVKFAELAPAGTRTVLGTVTFGELEVMAMEIPPTGATPCKVTVPVVVLPPITVAGFTLNPANPAGVMSRLALTETPPAIAVMVADVVSPTPLVFMENIVEVAPPGTVTKDWMEATGLSLDSQTFAPAKGAG